MKEVIRMSSVQELINDINESREKARQAGYTTYDTKSQKDEVAIMKAMLNDKTYRVGVYSSSGLQSEYCPAVEIRKTLSSIVQNATGIPSNEADTLMDRYEFKNQDAQGMIGFSKEFVNTYLQTGRKLPLGGRARSNISIIKKTVPGGRMLYPSSVNKSNVSMESKEVFEEEHDTIRVYGSCPEWLKHKKEEGKNGN